MALSSMVAKRIWLAGLARLVPHKVGKLHEVARKLGSRPLVRDGFLQSLLHAPQPLIAFGFSDGKRQMPRAQSWMAEAFDIHWRPARPSHQKPKQFVARFGQIRRMQRAKPCGFRCGVHQIVKPIHQGAHRLLSTNCFKKCFLHSAVTICLPRSEFFCPALSLLSLQPRL